MRRAQFLCCRALSRSSTRRVIFPYLKAEVLLRFLRPARSWAKCQANQLRRCCSRGSVSRDSARHAPHRGAATGQVAAPFSFFQEPGENFPSVFITHLHQCRRNRGPGLRSLRLLHAAARSDAGNGIPSFAAGVGRMVRCRR